MLIFKAIGRALSQLDDPAFRKVVLLGFALSLAVFAAVLAGLIALVPLIPPTGIGWLDTGIDWFAGLSVPVLFVLALYLFFPAVTTMAMSLFLDDIVDAVEARHYPQTAGWRRSSVLEGTWLALKLSAVIVLVNLAALPVYIALLVTGIGTLLLYLALNGYLMGREYFEIVAVHHGTPRQAARMRRATRDQAFIGGVAIAGLFLVPIVNLLAPVLGAATMVHLFHGARAREAVAS